MDFGNLITKHISLLSLVNVTGMEEEGGTGVGFRIKDIEHGSSAEDGIKAMTENKAAVEQWLKV